MEAVRSKPSALLSFDSTAQVTLIITIISSSKTACVTNIF